MRSAGEDITNRGIPYRLLYIVQPQHRNDSKWFKSIRNFKFIRMIELYLTTSWLSCDLVLANETWCVQFLTKSFIGGLEYTATLFLTWPMVQIYVCSSSRIARCLKWRPACVEKKSSTKDSTVLRPDLTFKTHCMVGCTVHILIL